jgi:hypothetical protein
MITVIITPPTDLEEGIEHIGTRVTLFKGNEIIGEPIDLMLPNDSILNHTFNVEAQPGELYKAKVAYIFEPGGLQEESEYTETIASESNDLSIYKSPPIRIPAPIITNNLGSIELPVVNNQFNIIYNNNINIDKIMITIIDEFDKVVEILELNNILKGDIKFKPQRILDFDGVFNLNAQIFSDSNVPSPISTYTFTTAKLVDRGYRFNKELGDYNLADPKELYLDLPSSVIYSQIDYIINNEVVGTWNIDTAHIALENRVNNKIDYLIRATGFTDDGEKYGPIYYYHNINLDDTLPSELPYTLH